MRRPILMAITLSAVLASGAQAKTFTRSPIAPELGLDALTRGVTRERANRDLFANPYATVTIGNVDVYDRFPYVESRRFQIVSDPRWNRLVVGEAGHGLSSYDGKSGSLGALSDPHGMAVGEANQVYVADTGNDRIVVLQASTKFDVVELQPRFAIGGLSRPYDVAFSDGGTPFEPADDMLYVADTGHNRVVAFALEASGARMVATLGDLGSGVGRFAGPMAIAAGRSNGKSTRDVYVADAHNRRLVRLRQDARGFTWVSESQHDADLVTSLDTDTWGNLYAAAPREGVIRKLTAGLAPVAELRGDLDGPKGFDVPFFDVRDHRDNTVSRVGQARGVSVERWSNATGIRLWNLGPEIVGLALDGRATEASFTLTDQADVTMDVLDASDGRVRHHASLGTLGAGAHVMALPASATGGASASNVSVRLTAVSSYPDHASDVAQSGGPAGVAVAQAMLLGNTPNPGTPTRIRFLLPAASAARATLGIFDASGRRVRFFDGGFAPGLNEVFWNGADDRGHNVRAGVYFYRLDVADRRLTKSLVVVR